MYEITILNTVFGNQSTFGGPLMGPFEDLLRRDVILRQSPGQSLGSFQVALDTKPVFETFNHLKLTTFLVQVTGVVDDFKMDKTSFFDPLQVLAPNTTRVVFMIHNVGIPWLWLLCSHYVNVDFYLQAQVVNLASSASSTAEDVTTLQVNFSIAIMIIFFFVAFIIIIIL
jgi:hypothetical protein